MVCCVFQWSYDMFQWSYAASVVICYVFQWSYAVCFSGCMMCFSGHRLLQWSYAMCFSGHMLCVSVVIRCSTVGATDPWSHALPRSGQLGHHPLPESRTPHATAQLLPQHAVSSVIVFSFWTHTQRCQLSQLHQLTIIVKQNINKGKCIWDVINTMKEKLMSWSVCIAAISLCC